MSEDLKKTVARLTTDSINQAMGQSTIHRSYEDQYDHALQNMNKLVQKILTI